MRSEVFEVIFWTLLGLVALAALYFLVSFLFPYFQKFFRLFRTPKALPPTNLQNDSMNEQGLEELFDAPRSEVPEEKQAPIEEAQTQRQTD